MSNSINTSRQIINLTQLFFYGSVEKNLHVDKLFNIVLKIRGVSIIILGGITIGITIIIRGITSKCPRIKITSLSIVVEIISRDKIHIYGITILLNQGRQRHIIKINRSTFISNQLHKSINFFTQRIYFFYRIDFLLVGALSVCHCE